MEIVILIKDDYDNDDAKAIIKHGVDDDDDAAAAAADDDDELEDEDDNDNDF
ncbi:hypothetical protein DPMN_073992 [Dreissena polymorpha]|uniref:Uncharacterized protein n=1 Tax=Dreissena polymorpha TaxID=45954 RepID=A0A9D4BDP1_DREPO|nr:hypothetical protein DPMN_073992 [Dreissena polymorpha]